MKNGVYTIFDRVAGTYAEPFICVNDATAKRKFNFIMSNAKMVSADCDLFKIGEFNAETGSLDAYTTNEFLCRFEGE